MKPTPPDLTYLETWARDHVGPLPHRYRPVENPSPFGDSPICATCHQTEALCAFDQDKPDVFRLVLALVAEARASRKSATKRATKQQARSSR